MNKAILLSNLMFLLILVSCQPGVEQYQIENPMTSADQENNFIVSYAIDNQLDLSKTESGIFYSITEAGEGEHPTKDNQITAHYHGTLLDGTVFDSSKQKGEPIKFKLSGVISGWQESIPMLKRGGMGTFIIPSALAYGDRAIGSIPPNSILRFDIELVDFQ